MKLGLTTTKRCAWSCLLARLAIALCLVVSIRGAEAGTVSSHQEFVGGQADHLVDKDGTLTIGDLMEAPTDRFIAANGRPANHGLPANAHSALWFRLAVADLPPDKDDWVLSLREPRTRHLQLFIVDAGGGAGLERNWDYTDPPPITAYPVIYLKRSDLVGRTLYLRVRTASSMRGSLWLQPAASFLTHYSAEVLYFGALLGVLVALAVYCAATGVAVGDLTLMLLAASTISIAAYIAGDRGLVESLIWPGAVVLSRLLSLGGTMMIYATSVLFSAAFLELPMKYRWTRLGVFVLSALFATAALLACIDVIDDRRFILPYSLWLGFLAILSIVAMGLTSALFQPRRAGLFLLCWAPALLTGLARIGLNLFPDALPAQPLTVNVVYFGVATSELVFAVITSIELRNRALLARAERAANEQRFRDFAATASDDFWETDADLVVTRSIEAGSPGARLAPGAPIVEQFAARGANVADLRGVLDRGAPFRDVRLRMSASGSGERYVSLSGLPIVTLGQGLVGWRGTLTDVSDQVAREWEHSHQRTLAALGFLIGSIAHDINNLLHPILNLSRRVGESMPAGDERISLLDIVTDSARQAAQIVAGVLGLTRSRAAARILPFGVAVAEAVDLIRSVNANGIRLVADIETKDGPLVAETDVFRILANLVSNAAAAMNNAGEVRVSYAAREGPSFLLEISDQGAGMSEAGRKLLEEETDDIVGSRGTGLGLMIVKHIIKSLDGRIEIRSNPDGGATVAITIPAMSEAVPAAAN